ncbi:MAG: hypothetical protein QW572_05950 [Candidatus Nitrosocaldus sp.]
MNKLAITGFAVIAVLAVAMLESVHATGGPPPSPADEACAKYEEQPSDAHTLTLNKSSALPGDTVTATATVTDNGTGANRIRFVWIDDTTNTIVQSNLYTRGSDSAPWARQDTFTVPMSAQPGDSFTVVACFESPNNIVGKGVTHHVNIGSFMVVPESILGMLGVVGAGLATFYAYRRK